MALKMAAEKRYYDACALEYSPQIIKEIVDCGNANSVIISHLSLGEAFGQTLVKGDKKIESFLNLISTLKQHIKVVGNDEIDSQLEVVREEITRISLTDAIHLATAVKYECAIIRTGDHDIYGIDQAKLDKIAKRFSLPCFKISEANFVPRSSYAKKAAARS